MLIKDQRLYFPCISTLLPMSSSQPDPGAGPSRSRPTQQASVDDAQIDPSLMQNLVHLPDVPPSALSNTQPNPVIRTDLSHRDI
jgi:hypothetical protein